MLFVHKLSIKVLLFEETLEGIVIVCEKLKMSSAYEFFYHSSGTLNYTLENLLLSKV